MRYLLDTHTFLWAVLDVPRLSDNAKAVMLNADNELLLSPASYWEIAVKISIGKYQIKRISRRSWSARMSIVS